MQFKFNTYNENYITINRFNIFLALAQFDKKNKDEKEEEMLQAFIDIQNSIINYEKNERKKGNYYPNTFDITIEKNSKIGAFLLTNKQIPKQITFEQITHSLLVCINKEEWEYYDELTKIIKKLKEEKYSMIDYHSLKYIIGNEITDYIINCQLYSTQTYDSDKTVYLYQNKKIIKTELPEQVIKSTKTKKRTNN